MRAALAQARRASGRTFPNPAVGAVVFRGDRVLGRGFTRPAGGPHAEIVALEGAVRRHGRRALRGATIAVTLEPCCHTGRTPPCTDALLEAGHRARAGGPSRPPPRRRRRNPRAATRRRCGRSRCARSSLPRPASRLSLARRARSPLRDAQARCLARRPHRDGARRVALDQRARIARVRASAAGRDRRRAGRLGHRARRRPRSHRAARCARGAAAGARAGRCALAGAAAGEALRPRRRRAFRASAPAARRRRASARSQRPARACCRFARGAAKSRCAAHSKRSLPRDWERSWSKAAVGWRPRCSARDSWTNCSGSQRRNCWAATGVPRSGRSASRGSQRRRRSRSPACGAWVRICCSKRIPATEVSGREELCHPPRCRGSARGDRRVALQSPDHRAPARRLRRRTRRSRRGARRSARRVGPGRLRDPACRPHARGERTLRCRRDSRCRDSRRDAALRVRVSRRHRRCARDHPRHGCSRRLRRAHHR